jgi:hypothetical protein
MSDFNQSISVDGSVDAGQGFLVNGLPIAVVPIGGILPFHKSLSGVPSLPVNFVECNGQTLSDGASPLNGQVIPDLNGSSGSKRFLRGATTSGGTGGADSHIHSLTTTGLSICTGSSPFASTSTTGSASSLPSYFETVMVMRVK